MLNELRGLAKVIDDIKLAIERDAPDLLTAGFNAYGQYAFMLSAEGQHRYLMEKQLSLESINLAFRQRLLMQSGDKKPRLSEASVRVLLQNTPLNLPLCSKVADEYPECMGLLAEQIFINPYWLSRSFDNSGSMVERFVSKLAQKQPVMTQAILTQVMELIDPQQMGFQFVDVLFDSIEKFDSFDFEFRSMIDRKKSLISSSLGCMIESKVKGIISISTAAKVRKLNIPDLTAHVLSPEFMVEFTATEQKQLHELASGDLHLNDENIQTFVAFDQNRGSKHSFITSLFLANKDIFLNKYSNALVSSFESQPTRLAQGLGMIVSATELLKKLGLYDPSRFIEITEDLYELLQKDEGLSPVSARIFVKHLPAEVIKNSSLMESSAVARELLEADLGI